MIPAGKRAIPLPFRKSKTTPQSTKKTKARAAVPDRGKASCEAGGKELAWEQVDPADTGSSQISGPIRAVLTALPARE